MEWLDARHPEYLDRLAALVAAGRIEIVGGAFYEADSDDDSAARPRRADHAATPSGSPTASARRSAACGCPSASGSSRSPATWPTPACEYTLLDDFHFKNAGLERRPAPRLLHHRRRRQAARACFPAASGCGTLIPFREPQETIDYLRQIAERQPGAVVVFGDDGEKFGTWPGTKEHVYDHGWLRQFFDALVANRDWLQRRRRRPKRSTACRRWARSTCPKAATAR